MKLKSKKIPAKRLKSKPRSKAQRSRLPISEADITALGLECDTLAKASALAKLPGRYSRTKPSRRLSDIFKKYPQLKTGWERGRFLRNLQQLGRTAVSVSEAARKLKLASGQVLREMLDSDAEVADIWEQSRLEVFVEAKAALVELAKDGNQAAIRAVEGMLRQEASSMGTTDLNHITTAQLIELTAKSRQTVHDWVSKFSLPRNADKTFDLNEFFLWFERHTLAKAGKEDRPVTMNPYQARRVQLMDIEIDKQKARLLNRMEVLAGIAARYERLVNVRRKIEELAAECAGSNNGQIREKLERFFDDLIEYQKQDFEELRLPELALTRFCEVLELIKDN